jgi:hypothetical protein
MKVYEIEYFDGCGISSIKIRAIDAREAKRIAKRMTGALIKDMTIGCVMGCGFKAAND